MQRHEVAAHRYIVIAAILSFAWFLYDGVAPGWLHTTTDFPNYYTAAKLTTTRTPLPAFYDYPEFQRAISTAGIPRQLGGYIPQTPLTMVPLVPLVSFEPLHAKRIWLVLNLGFLCISVWLLSKITRFPVAQVWLIVFLGYAALRENFHLGQYYILLLTILTAAVYFLQRSADAASGTAFGAALVLKLYGAPFVLFLAAKRRSRAVFAIIVVAVAASVLAIAMFGWDGLAFYAAQILPRSLSGETLNPYHPSNNTLVTLLRRLLVFEPGLNPHPLIDSPATFAFLRTAFTLTVLLFPVLAAWNQPGSPTRNEIAWWSITLLLVSPNTASYTFVLLALPVVLLLDERQHREWPYILIPYAALALPLRSSGTLLFPRAWLLLFLFLWVGSRYLGSISRGVAVSAAAGILCAGAGAAVWAGTFPERPAVAATPLTASFASPGAIYSNVPVPTASGLFFESIAEERYAIGLQDKVKFQALTREGHALHPSAPDTGDRVYFELVSGTDSTIGFFDPLERRSGTVALDPPHPHDPAVAHDGSRLAFVSGGRLYLFDGRGCRRLNTAAPVAAPVRDPTFVPGDGELVYVAGTFRRSQIMQVSLSTGESTVLVDRDTELSRPSISPDRSTLVYASRQTGSWQIWTKDLARHIEAQLTSGRCNSSAPAWMLRSNDIIFASDCNRGLNLPALFRMPAGPSGQELTLHLKSAN